jgi:hypothetical protein
MDKEYFNNMTLSEQLAHVNTRLDGGESMRSISSSLGIHKNTIPSLLTKNGYVLDKIAKQYILDSSQQDQPTTKQANKPIPVTSQDHIPTFNIPTKTKIKTKTKAFNVIMKESLANNIDVLAKEKGYSRNEIINIMCEYCLNNMK